MHTVRFRLPAMMLTGLALTAAAGLNVAAASPRVERVGSPTTCPSAKGAIQASELETGRSAWECGLVGRLVTHKGVGVRIPTAGEGVSVSADSGSGGVSLNVRTSPEGVVTADFHGSEPDAGSPQVHARAGAAAVAATGAATATGATAATAAADPACSMTASRFNGWMWDPKVTASFLANTTEALPANISGATFLSVQKTAAARISAAYNNCGIVFDPSITVAFSATTTFNSNINGATNACTTRDARNVLDFGSLNGSTLALNCTWYQYVSGGYSKIIESDTRFDNTSRSWVTTTSGCTGARYDLLSVATHEMGHWVGLGHVADSGSNDLTMSPVIAACNASAQTLGRGDITALNVPY